ncbi:MAG: hypothetical protein R3C10_10900 [Pirellulales bacterium]|nr:hypothetical protein [Planctomycetales bacterium]
MRTLRGFVLGAIVGGVVTFFAPRYHVLRTGDGVQFVPKVSSTLADTYVDVRKFGIDEWNDHKLVAAALVASGKSDVLQDAGAQGVLDGFENILLGRHDTTEAR